MKRATKTAGTTPASRGAATGAPTTRSSRAASPITSPVKMEPASVEEEEDRRSVVERELAELLPPKLKCQICTEDLQAGHTALLPCAHTFCRPCLAKQLPILTTPSAKEDSSATAEVAPGLACPVCHTRHPAVVTAVDVDALPADPFAEAQLQPRLLCAPCKAEGEDIPAVYRCTKCHKALCEGDAHKHRLHRASAKHPLARLATPLSPDVCPAHQQPLHAYCVPCRAVCCAFCLTEDHLGNNHQPTSLAKQLPTLRAQLEDSVTPAQARQDELVTRLIDTGAAAATTCATVQQLCSEITVTFDAVSALLQARKLQLLQEAAAIEATEAASLDDDATADRLRWLALQGPRSAAERLLGANNAPTPPIEPRFLGTLGPALRDQLAATARMWVPPAPAAPRLAFELGAVVEDAVRTAGRLVFLAAYGPNCTAAGVNLHNINIHSTTSIVVTARTAHGDPLMTGGDTVAIWLGSARADKLLEAAGGVAPDAAGAALGVTISDLQNGTYGVEYGVAATGSYMLHVTVNGRPISGSPFQVMATAGKVFRYAGNAPTCYDNNGILYHLTCQSGGWRNPSGNILDVTVSSASNDPANFVNNAGGGALHSNNAPDSWFAINLRTRRVRPSGYVLSNSSGCLNGNHFARSWVLEVSNDDTTWTVLRAHDNDGSLHGHCQACYWPIETSLPPGVAWTRFRIRQTGKNAAGNDHLAVSGFELYGELDP